MREVDPNIPALILTSYDDDEALFAAILADASGYVLKQITGNDLVDGVRRVAAGQSLIDPVLRREGVRPGAPRSRDARRARRAGAQGARPDRGGADQPAIGAQLYLAEKTVKNYVSSILAKLGVERRTQAAVLASRLVG